MVGVPATSRASATYGVAPAAVAGVFALAAMAAWGDVGHAHGPDEGTQVPLALWLLKPDAFSAANTGVKRRPVVASAKTCTLDRTGNCPLHR